MIVARLRRGRWHSNAGFSTWFHVVSTTKSIFLSFFLPRKTSFCTHSIARCLRDASTTTCPQRFRASVGTGLYFNRQSTSTFSQPVAWRGPRQRRDVLKQVPRARVEQRDCKVDMCTRVHSSERLLSRRGVTQSDARLHYLTYMRNSCCSLTS